MVSLGYLALLAPLAQSNNVFNLVAKLPYEVALKVICDLPYEYLVQISDSDIDRHSDDQRWGREARRCLYDSNQQAIAAFVRDPDSYINSGTDDNEAYRKFLAFRPLLDNFIRPFFIDHMVHWDLHNIGISPMGEHYANSEHHQHGEFAPTTVEANGDINPGSRSEIGTEPDSAWLEKSKVSLSTMGRIREFQKELQLAHIRRQVRPLSTLEDRELMVFVPLVVLAKQGKVDWLCQMYNYMNSPGYRKGLARYLPTAFPQSYLDIAAYLRIYAKGRMNPSWDPEQQVDMDIALDGFLQDQFPIQLMKAVTQSISIVLVSAHNLEGLTQYFDHITKPQARRIGIDHLVLAMAAQLQSQALIDFAQPRVPARYLESMIRCSALYGWYTGARILLDIHLRGPAQSRFKRCQTLLPYWNPVFIDANGKLMFRFYRELIPGVWETHRLGLAPPLPPKDRVRDDDTTLPYPVFRLVHPKSLVPKSAHLGLDPTVGKKSESQVRQPIPASPSDTLTQANLKMGSGVDLTQKPSNRRFSWITNKTARLRKLLNRTN
ncbi:hypothetical protein BJ085DRAFT_38634 [Dimargaris cristalligena]|uniref:F-box domain-containing protein n=1 Tax=Dimargaris cristalligena TaxID=215637 RepID=A0A4P9ZV12_9FUNG|nr:hypothetical protein BJ085DRAFT_38634 [Dimargaris cristalligena]|eukprot:RKP37108.1 hypothetical protein BJ085DRAFT_38634 [Dimargaris cristalligena]